MIKELTSVKKTCQKLEKMLNASQLGTAQFAGSVEYTDFA